MTSMRPGFKRAIICAIGAFGLAIGMPLAAQADDFVVTTLPSAGWIESLENTAGGTVAFVEGPASPLVGRGSLELTVASAADFSGIGRVESVLGPLSDITDGSWSTYVTGLTATPDAEPPSLRFAMNRRLGEFTTMVVERVYNGGVLPDAWQTTELSDSTVVWQTNRDEDFCLVEPVSRCTFGEFKAHYPMAAVLGLQAAIGTGVEPTSSYLDAVELTVGGVTDTWDFELPAELSSTATIGAVTPTATGGTVPVTLTASEEAAGDVEFIIMVGGTPQVVTLAPGETTTVNVTVPFGATNIQVLAQGIVIANADVTVAQPTPSPSPSPSASASPSATATATATATGGSSLVATGSDMTGPLAVAGALIVTGAVALAAARRRS